MDVFVLMAIHAKNRVRLGQIYFSEHAFSRPRAVTGSTEVMRPPSTIKAKSKLFTVGQTCRGTRYTALPIAGTSPDGTSTGRCSSLGLSGLKSGWPATT